MGEDTVELTQKETMYMQKLLTANNGTNRSQHASTEHAENLGTGRELKSSARAVSPFPVANISGTNYMQSPGLPTSMFHR